MTGGVGGDGAGVVHKAAQAGVGEEARYTRTPRPQLYGRLVQVSPLGLGDGHGRIEELAERVAAQVYGEVRLCVGPPLSSMQADFAGNHSVPSAGCDDGNALALLAGDDDDLFVLQTQDSASHVDRIGESLVDDPCFVDGYRAGDLGALVGPAGTLDRQVQVHTPPQFKRPGSDQRFQLINLSFEALATADRLW